MDCASGEFHDAYLLSTSASRPPSSIIAAAVLNPRAAYIHPTNMRRQEILSVDRLSPQFCILLQTTDGTFSEAASTADIASTSKSRGAALVDLNNDGQLDLVVVNRGNNLEVSQNQHQTGNWLLLDVHQIRPNRSAVGNFIKVHTSIGVQTREITVGGGHAGGTIGLQHFGLGTDRFTKIKVIWPDGDATDWRTVQANQIVHIHR